MGQIVRRKKKGRPSKADLARRSGESAAAKEAEIRRSLRRRNVRYNIDYDDYLEEDDEDDEEDERRREKKLKLVVKLNQGKDGTEEPSPSRGRHGERGGHAPENASEDEEEEGERKPLKKRRINGGGDDDDDDEQEEEDDEDENDDVRGGGGDDDDDEDEVCGLGKHQILMDLRNGRQRDSDQSFEDFRGEGERGSEKIGWEKL